MNKTININLGGFFFHIDEAAYQKLSRYLDAIGRSLSDDPQGKDEIIADIEARISELLSERITDARQVVNEGDIDEIITIMGQPEDYAEAEDGYSENTAYKRKSKSSSKKLFRDGDDKFLGGVCSGLGHYLGIDTIWIRLAFLLLLASGFSPLIYIILWILLPEAQTTAEKLQMEGEAVNIDNIEKKIRDEFNNISTKIKDGASHISEKISKADYDKYRSESKTGFQDFIDTMGKILLAVFKVFGKFLGALLVFVSGITLVSLLLGIFSIGSFEILNIDNDLTEVLPIFYDSVLPSWLLTTFLFLFFGVPFLVLLVLGLRILSPNLKKLNGTTVIILLALWLVSLLGLGFTAIEYGTSRAYDGTKIEKQTLQINPKEPLKIRVVNDDNLQYKAYLSSSNNANIIAVDDVNKKYSNHVKISVKRSETATAYLEVKKTSEGRKRSTANTNAEQLEYKFKTANNQIVFDAFFLSEIKNLLKDEEVKLTLYLPEGTKVYFEESAKNFLYYVKNTDDLYDEDLVNHELIMTAEGLDCLDCETPKKSDIDSTETAPENTDWDQDSKEDISFLFDSTINDGKAELIITSETTKSELQKLVRWFKKRRNIDIDFDGSEFDAKGKIIKYALHVDCNDGFHGRTKQQKLVIANGKHGFVRHYDKDNTTVNFSIW